MKNLIIYISILCAVFFLACKKDNKPGNASFTSEFDFLVDVPAQPNISTKDTTIAVTSEISINDSRLEDCDKASLKSFYIEIREPASQTFDFCREAHLLLSAPGIPEVDLISAVNINPSSRRIDFNVNSIELIQFLHQKSFTAKVRVVCMKGFTNPIKLYGNIVFNVQGKLKK
ncbi:MAG: hypothetical protein V4635_02845 [Bacteroidota bacterium]